MNGLKAPIWNRMSVININTCKPLRKPYNFITKKILLSRSARRIFFILCYLSDDCTLALLALTNLQPVNKAATRHMDAEVTNTTCIPSINNSGRPGTNPVTL